MNTNNSKTVLTIVVGLLVFYLLFHHIYLLYAALAVGLLSILSSFVESKIAWLWLKLAELLGYLNSKVILSLVFFCFLLPIAFLSRLIKGNNTLGFKRKPGNSSYYKERNHVYSAKDLENAW